MATVRDGGCCERRIARVAEDGNVGKNGKPTQAPADEEEAGSRIILGKEIAARRKSRREIFEPRRRAAAPEQAGPSNSLTSHRTPFYDLAWLHPSITAICYPIQPALQRRSNRSAVRLESVRVIVMGTTVDHIPL